MKRNVNRREFIQGVSAAAAGLCLAPSGLWASAAPAAPVAVARCDAYGPEVVTTLSKMFDQLGGLGRLVNGKTVAIKLNLTGDPDARLGYTSIGQTAWVHPAVVGATVHLMGQAGATRIRLLESPWKSAEPLEEYMIMAGWEPRDFVNAAPRVEFENTNFLGRGKEYARFPVPHGGHLFPAFDLNHSYRDCDVFVSIAKLKEHITAGVTMSAKNCFGIHALHDLRRSGAGVDEPGRLPLGGRMPIHAGNRQPSKTSPPEKDPSSPREGGYRVPRCVADLVAARPIHLAMIDGIGTMASGEGPWYSLRAVRPGLLVAGTNGVNTDAVGTALMGFDPMAERGTAPFEKCDSTLRLAEELGVGTRDLKRIEVRGLPIEKGRIPFRST